MPLIAFPQNYDLSISEAPKLFSDAEFEAVKRIQQALAVLLLRKRLKVNNMIVQHKVYTHKYRHFFVECPGARSFRFSKGSLVPCLLVTVITHEYDTDTVLIGYRVTSISPR